MFRLVLCSVFIILRAEANVPETENPVIRLSNVADRNENYTVWKDKPLKIIIENTNTRLVWCTNKYSTSDHINSTKFVPDTEFKNGNIHIINITSVTAEMSTRWMCTVLEEYHGPVLYEHNKRLYTAKNLHFHLHVKGARAVILNANNQNLTYVTTNLLDNYDGEVSYVYQDGEDFPMDFSCKKAEDKYSMDTLRLEYYNAEGILLFQTKPRVTPHTFRFALKSNNDKYYLDCIRAARNPEREYRYRTTFYKRDLNADVSQHAVIFSVNGQKLSTTSLNNDKSYDNYIFRYIDGELLTVTCQKRNVDKTGQLFFFADRMSQTLMSYNPSEAVISLNTSDIHNKSLICGINNTNGEQRSARLFFLSDVSGKDVRIRGLLRNNILYQYTNDISQWTIEYQYSVNDTLDLTCVWNAGPNIISTPLEEYANPFQWYFVDKSFDSAAIEMPNTHIKFSDQPLTRILNATHIGTKIKCTYFPYGKYDYKSSKTVEIILRLKPELDSEANLDTTDVKNSTRFQKKALYSISLDDKSMTMIVPISVGVGVATAVIMMVCLVSWHKRTKRTNLIENAYDNLSNQNDSPIPPFPSQWENNYDDPNYDKNVEKVKQENIYNYASDNDKLCRMPGTRQSNTTENHYTEIDDYPERKLGGLEANWNIARPSNYNKQKDTLKATPSYSSNNACYNNFSGSKQDTYDKLRHNNLPINSINENYSNVTKPTFGLLSNGLRPGYNYSEGNSRQDGRNNERKVKPNNDGHYANTGQDNIYMQPGKPIYQNNFPQNEKTNNPLDSDYAEPYGISCNNDFYG